MNGAYSVFERIVKNALSSAGVIEILNQDFEDIKSALQKANERAVQNPGSLIVTSEFYSESEKPEISLEPTITFVEEKEENTTLEEVAPQPIEDLPPTFSWISASSTLKDYPVKNTTDGDLKTTWLEGVKGNGINEWVMYSSEENQKVSSITLYNGYLKNDKVYLNNGRIKKLSIEFSDGETITRDLEKASFSEAKNGVVITLDEPKVTTSVKLTILDAYQGSYYTDTGFSEIKFN